MSSIADAERALVAADEAFGRWDVDAVIAHLSTAIQAFTAAGEPARAAMACLRLGDAFANGLGNLIVGRAWFARARRLVADEPPCIEQGWVAVAGMGCDRDDPDALVRDAETALALARRFGDVNLETKALADGGLAHVQAGRITEGMAMLDEAMALACGPADDPDQSARSVCSFFTACYFATDVERVASWEAPLRGRGLIGSTPGPPLFLASHCTTVQASLLVELGRWTEAEEVLTACQAEFEAGMGTPAWHPRIGLAELRVRQGRLAEAEALLLGFDQALEALLPAARLHLARGDHDLARAAARRGLRNVGADRLRAVELLGIVVDAELAAGSVDGAQEAARLLGQRVAGLDVPSLEARTALVRARAAVAAGDRAAAVALLEDALDRADPSRLPWLRLSLLVALAAARSDAGDRAGARLDAAAAAALLATLDVHLPAADAALLDRLCRERPSTSGPSTAGDALLVRDGAWWVVSHDGTSARLRASKGLHYLADLVAHPGAERHALDLVDRVEGVERAGPSRRHLGDAGPVLDGRARTEYRHRIEALRAEADEALASGRLDRAEEIEGEVGQLVGQLAEAFGLGGRERRAASAVEKARLNVTRALRAATARVADALPEAGAALDRGVRTGTYCRYEPGPGDVRWIVQPGLNGGGPP